MILFLSSSSALPLFPLLSAPPPTPLPYPPPLPSSFLPPLLVLQVLIGNREWMSINHVPVKEVVEEQVKHLEELGNTLIFVAIDGT